MLDDAIFAAFARIRCWKIMATKLWLVNQAITGYAFSKWRQPRPRWRFPVPYSGVVMRVWVFFFCHAARYRLVEVSV
jgi:hypothetical protein